MRSKWAFKDAHLGSVINRHLVNETPYKAPVPYRVEYIARLTVWASPFDSLTNILHLLLTNSTISRRLTIQNSPHLYARIFKSRFDMAAPRRRLDPSTFTDSALAMELVYRYRLLRRIRRHDLADQGINQDMWTLYWLILENDSMNSAQLTSVGYCDFLLDLIFSQLRQGGAEKACEHEALSLSLWAYCLAVSSQDITSIPPDRIQDLLALLRPLVMSARKDIDPSHPANPSQLPAARSVQADIDYPRLSCLPDIGGEIRIYSRPWQLTCPPAQSAAIILTFVLKELVPLQVPPHLPLDRVTAIAQNRAGPTMEDYRALATCRTSLFNDLVTRFSPSPNPESPYLNVTQSMRFEEDFNRVLTIHRPTSSAYPIPYTPGTLSGLWEGTFLVCPISSTTASSTPLFADDFVARKPMYCQLTEYLCCDRENPIPSTLIEPHAQSSWDFHPARIMPAKGGLEFSSNTYRYEKVEEAVTRPYSHAKRWPKINDIVILGETPGSQEDAWGGYRFSGNVRLSDGFITLKRVSKDVFYDHPWIFEGYLYYGSAFVGTWRTHGNPCSVDGIFSLRRRTAECQHTPSTTPAH